MNRRTFFKGLAASSLAAPAIIKYELLMPVKSLIIPKINFEFWNEIIAHGGKLYINGIGHPLISDTIEVISTKLLPNVAVGIRQEIVKAYNNDLIKITLTKIDKTKARMDTITYPPPNIPLIPLTYVGKAF